MIACEVCGTDNDDKLTFCRTCGHRLKPKKSRVVPPTPATAMKGVVTAKPNPPAVQAAPVDLAADADVPADKTKCGQCGALSPISYRFCISCGSVLKSAKPAATSGTKAGVSDRPVQPQPQAQRPGGGDSIACKECGGVCEGGESFCKYCGAPLPKRSQSPRGRPAKAVPKARLREESAVDLTDDVEPADAFPLAAAGTPGPPPARSEPAHKPRAEPARAARAKPKDKDKEGVTGRLVVIVEDGSEGKTLELRGRQVDIGSAEGDIVLGEDRYLSPRHARFFRQDGAWYLRDLDSLNGVYRRLRKPTRLKNRDLVLLGLEVLEFQLVDHAERGLGHAIEHGVLLFGSPAATRRARLCQRTVEGIVRDVYHLVADETTIGRETGDIVFTSDPFMSRRHAAIQWDEDAQEYVLVDLNSSNGTYLAIREDVRLENGDFIRLGQHLFRVDLPQKPSR